MKKLFTLPLCLLFMLNAFAQGSLNKRFDNVRQLRMSTASGDCKLVKGTGPEVVVELHHTYDTDVFHPEVTQEEERLFIKEVFSGNTSGGRSTWTITLPDNLEIKFSTGSGNLVASNLTAEIDINTGSGDIELQEMKGEVKANTGSGDIDGKGLSGELKMNTGSGDIAVSNSSGEVNLNCGSGDIRIDNIKASFRVNSGSGTVRSNRVTLTGSSSFNSGSGDAEVVLAATPKYDVTVNSGSGDATLNFDGNAIEGEIVMRANKRRGEIQAPFEFDKTEEIEQGNQLIVKKTVQKGSSDVKVKIGTGSGTATIK